VIRLIGHSASDQDVPYLREIFADARNCERWEVHNLPGPADTVRDRLVTLLDIPEERIRVTEVAFGGSSLSNGLPRGSVGDSFR
jgi:hypothetical protein